MHSSSGPYREPVARDFYRKTMHILIENRVPFLVGGAYALNRYSGVERDTKDFDVFVLERDYKRALSLMASAGYKTEVTDVRWIAKAFFNQYFVDFIFGSANCVAMVDDQWFEHALPSEVLGVPCLLIPPEEMIWQKAFIMERDRFDGADVVHVMHACSDKLDWNRLLERFDGMWSVLLIYLIYFDFIYPSDRHLIPEWLLNALLSKFETEQYGAAGRKLCRGTLFSTTQYAIDLEKWGYKSAKEYFVKKRFGELTEEDVA